MNYKPTRLGKYALQLWLSRKDPANYEFPYRHINLKRDIKHFLRQGHTDLKPRGKGNKAWKRAEANTLVSCGNLWAIKV